MEKLKGFQRKYLRGLAQSMKPVVMIGEKGFTDTVAQAIDEALLIHELIKIKFIDFKEKDQKKGIASAIEAKAECEMVGMIGHMATFYREHSEPEKRKIKIPKQHKKS